MYTCTFDVPTVDDGVSHRLAFDGLDTLCDVYLVSPTQIIPDLTPLTRNAQNGQKILQTDNAFRQWVHDTKGEAGVIKATNNVLLLHFHCAKTYAKAQEAVYGKVRAGSTNLGDPSRVYLRKPQYDWR